MEKFNGRNAEMKKYDLALKNRIYNNTSVKLPRKNKIINEKINENKIFADKYDAMNSQNIKLRISESFTIEDSDNESNISKPMNNNKPENQKGNEVIIISDSSDDESSLDLLPKSKTHGFQSCLKPNNNKNRNNSSTDLKNIELSDEDSDIYTGSMPRKQSPENPGNKNYSQTSDETNFDLIIDETKDSIVDSSLKIESKNQPMTPLINQSLPQNTEKTSDSVIKKKFTPGSTKLSECTTPLSRKDAKYLMKLIKSKRLESPVVPKNNIIDDSDEDVTDEEPMQPVQHPAWIDDSAQDDDDILLPKPSKTHVTRFLNPSIEPTDELTEQKKREISRWLMNNPENPGSDDSISNVSPSTKNASSSSGDSSLDRLEINYETPNNRDKFRDKSTIRGKNEATKLNNMQTPRQTVMDDYMKKIKSSRPKNHTPTIQKAVTIAVPSVKTPVTSLGDCADILDKIYGATWRQKTNAPTTEPRRAVILQDRAVQTERIKKSKKITSNSTNSNDKFSKFIKDIEPGLNSTKKGSSTNRRNNYRDSFINDSSDSGDGVDTTYLTALTNPRISGEQDLRRKNTPVSANTLKAIEICDSDSDDENCRAVRGNINNRRRLSFSDDENELRSSTSEYDPDDIVLPKSVLPKVINKVDEFKRPSALIASKCKGFLASLSGSVPLENCHPDAKKYRLNFKNNKEELVKYLYKLYNDKIFDNQLPDDMLIEWNVRMRGTAGFCYNKRVKSLTGSTRTSRMALATKILDRPERLRDTLVHEMCHAAAWIINDVSDGHGPFWKAWASKAMRVFPELPPIKRCHDYEISTKFTYRCVQCGYSIGRHSKSLDIAKKRCGHCFGKFELLLNRVTKSGTKLQIPRTPKAREPSAFAMFVKENYSTLKKERRGMAHKEVMQLLGQQFSAIKLSKKNDNERNNSEHST